MWDPYIEYRNFHRYKTDNILDFHSWMRSQFNRYIKYRNIIIPEIADLKEKEKYLFELKHKWLGDFHHWLRGPSAGPAAKI